MSHFEQLIREGYAAWNRGDWQRMEELLAPDFELDATERVLNPDRYHGIDGFRQLAAEMEEIWDSWDVEAEEFIENGELVFAAHQVHARGNGNGSGIEINRTYWSVWTVRGDKAAKLVLYADRGRALAAAGIA
jgi:ketosteroid isomerase-like protein